LLFKHKGSLWSFKTSPYGVWEQETKQVFAKVDPFGARHGKSSDKPGLPYLIVTENTNVAEFLLYKNDLHKNTFRAYIDFI